MPVLVAVAAATGFSATIGAGVLTAIGVGTVSTAVATAVGTGLIAGGLTAVQGGSAGDVLKSAVLGGTLSYIGGEIGQAVFGSGGSGVSQAALDAANATSDPIAALNAIQGWTTSDLSYLQQIGASEAIIQAAMANNAVLTSGQVPQTNIPQSAIEAANLTDDPIAALNASQGWTANDIGYLFDIGADRALIDTAIANNLKFGLEPTITDKGIQNWVGLDAAKQSELLAKGVDPTRAYQTMDGGFGYQTADGLGYAVNPIESFGPGLGRLPDGSIGVIDEAAYLRSMGFDPAKFDYQDLGGGSSQIVPISENITSDFLNRVQNTAYAQANGIDASSLDYFRSIGYSEDQIIAAMEANPNGGWGGQLMSQTPGAPVVTTAPTEYAAPDGGITQIFDDGSTLITSPTGDITTTPATDLITPVSPEIVQQPTGPTITQNADGSTTQTFDDGSTLTTSPTGQITATPATDVITPVQPTMPSGPTVTQNADGSTTQTFDDGSTLTTSPTGEISSTPATDVGISPPGPNTTNTTTNTDGSNTQTFDDGSTLTTNPDGTITTTPATDAATGGWSADLLRRLGLEGLSSTQILGLMAAGALAPDILRALGILPEEPVATGPNYGDAFTSTLPSLTKKDLVKPGINPGLMPVQPYYQTTRPEQPQYYWGVRPYAESQADLAKMQTQIPGAPAQPFGYDVKVPQGFDVAKFIAETISPQQSQALAGAGGQYNIYGQPAAPATPAAPMTVQQPAPTGFPAVADQQLTPVNTQGPVDQFADFYSSPEYAAFNAQLGDDAIRTMDMYESPYFGWMSSGSIGRAQDRVYEQYLARTQPTAAAQPVAPAAVIAPAAQPITQMAPVTPDMVMTEAPPVEPIPYMYMPSFGLR